MAAWFRSSYLDRQYTKELNKTFISFKDTITKYFVSMPKSQFYPCKTKEGGIYLIKANARPYTSMFGR